MADLDTMQDRYAELAIRTGVNIRPGQVLMVVAALDAAPFVRALARHAYAAGAHDVHVLWEDPLFDRVRLEHAPEAALNEYPRHVAAWFEEVVASGGARVRVSAPYPGVYDGVPPARVATAAKAQQHAMRRVMQAAINMEINWLVVAAPTQAWADRVLPELPAAERVDALWGYILRATRMDRPDPLAAWRAHAADLDRRARALQRHHFRYLRYRAPGTDLTIELPTEHHWVRATDTVNARGVPFIPNLPTEEVFSAPLRGGTQGVVRSTLPLVYRDTVIEGLTLHFRDGRIVSFDATAGREAFAGLLDTDEGSGYLGEVALVPVDSPIAQTGKLFFNTLFDENASCHLAVGDAYPVCIAGGQRMDPETIRAKGLNSSASHVDFMVGSPELDIDGEAEDGRTVPVFRRGNWAAGLEG